MRETNGYDFELELISQIIICTNEAAAACQQQKELGLKDSKSKIAITDPNLNLTPMGDGCQS